MNKIANAAQVLTVIIGILIVSLLVRRGDLDEQLDAAISAQSLQVFEHGYICGEGGVPYDECLERVKKIIK